MDINFSRQVDLSVKFLPHLLAKAPAPTAIVFTGSLLAAVPAVMVPAYSASKAALTAYASCLRRQHPGSSTRIIEVWPPLVQSKPQPSRLSPLITPPLSTPFTLLPLHPFTPSPLHPSPANSHPLTPLPFPQ